MLDRDIGLQDYPDPPEPEVVAHCAWCDGAGEIFEGEQFGYDGNSCICSECIDKLWGQLTLDEKLEHFGYRIVRA
jgi:hypothetical protein